MNAVLLPLFLTVCALAQEAGTAAGAESGHDSIRASLLAAESLRFAAADSMDPGGPPPVSPFYREGFYYDQEGEKVVITRKHMARLRPVNFADLLDNVPGMEVARQYFLGTLSDLKFAGKEDNLLKDDQPILIEVDGIEAKNLSLDRVYLTEISVNDVERVEIERGRGGLSGGELRIRVFTRDDFAVNPRSDIFWENGPFEMGAFRFAFMRRLGPKAGIYVGTEKIFMFENLGLYSGGSREYTHPAAIRDIYRAFLRRPESLYVSGGAPFENSARNWDVKLNTAFVPGINVMGGFEFSGDTQDDYRDDPQGLDPELNFATRHHRERFYLTGRTLAEGPWRARGNVFTESARLRMAANPAAQVPSDTQFLAQGVDAWGGGLSGSYEKGPWTASVQGSAHLDTWQGRGHRQNVRREAVEAQAGYRFPVFLNLPAKASGALALRRDTRLFSDEAPNTRLSLSPSAALMAGDASGWLWDLMASLEERLPAPEAFYFDNPRLQYAPGEVDVRPYDLRRFSTGVAKKMGGLRAEYRVGYSDARSPAALLPERDSTQKLEWVLSGEKVSSVSRIEQEFALELELGPLCNRFYFLLYDPRVDYEEGEDWNPGLGFRFDNRLEVKKGFVRGNLEVFWTLHTRGRPEVYALDFYKLGRADYFEKLPYFLIFDFETGFKIREFIYYARFDNLSNQVITYEPGYHLPGPTLRWGLVWTLGG